jgi:transposase-like protein
MTEDPNQTIATSILDPILNYGLEGLPDAVAVLINHAMRLEREHHIGAGPYQRTDQRDGYANGFKERQLNTRIGTIPLRVPQVRGSEEPFFPSALERGQRSEKALTIAIAEMYLQGVSTRRVTKIMEELCGLDVTSSQVSKAAAELDEMLEAWRTRELEAVSHLVLDARYEKVRYNGVVRSCAVLIAVGVRTRDGKRSVLGCSVSLSEAEVHWREFLASLKKRGLELPKSTTSDAHEGLKAALETVFPGGAWQRCQFHLQQNAQAYVPKQSMKEEVAADIRAIFHTASLAEAEQKLAKAVQKYRKSAPELSAWMETNLPEGFTVFSLPEPVRKRLRTSNLMENLNHQIRRRTRVASIFPNTPSCLRLVSAILMEISDEWEDSKAYLNPKHLI